MTFLLWKFSFTANVNGFFSFKDIMLRIPLNLDFSLLIRIEKISFSFTFSSKILKVSTYGLQLNLLIKNEFDMWVTKKIELLQMLEDIRTSLKKKGLLKSFNQLVTNLGSLSQNASNSSGHAQGIRRSKSDDSSPISHLQGSQSHPHNTEKSLQERMLHKLLGSFEVELFYTFVNFWVYQDPEKNIEESNLRKFYQQQLLDNEFRDQYLCFRVFTPKAQVNIKSMTDEELDLMLVSDTVYIQNPKNLDKQGIFKTVSALIKVPLDKKLAKDFCNFDVRVSILRGTINLNKKFLKSIAKFFVYMDTLKDIIKRIKKLITKLHFQDELLKDDGMHGEQNEFNYENWMDEDIPKRLKVVIEEGLSIIMSEPLNQLRPFMTSGEDSNRSKELVVLNTHQITFELLRTLKNSYYMTVQSQKIYVECNMRKSIIINNFNLEMDFCFKKELKNTPLKNTKMEITNTIRIEQVICDLTQSEVKLILDIIELYVQMVFIASVKNRIMAILLDKEFMRNNLMYLGTSPEELIKEQRIMQLFTDQKFKDILVQDIIVSKFEGKICTYDPANQIKFNISNYRFRFKNEKGIEELINKLDFINIQPIRKNSISLLKIQNLSTSICLTKGHEKNIKNISFTFDKCHCHVNLELVLQITKELLDCSFVMKSYSRKWDFKYIVKEHIKQTIIESFLINFQESQLVWQLSKSRYVALSLLEFKTKPILCPFKNEGKFGMSYITREMALYHSKTTLEETVPNYFYCGNSEEKDVQTLALAQNIEYKMIMDEKQSKVKIIADTLDFNLPDGLHFGALIHEIVKQISVTSKWFSIEYMKVKKQYNIQFFKPMHLQQQRQSAQKLNNATNQQQTSHKRSFFLQINVQQALLQCDDSALKMLFVNKSEVVDSLQEREIFRCKPPFIFKLLKKLKQSKLNEKLMIYQLRNFKMIYEIPQQLLDFNQVFQVIQKLDEARDCMTPILFKEFDSAVHTYSADYISWHVRNLLRPIVEVYDVEVKFLFINANLNPDINPSLFKTKVYSKIFDKYEIQHSYNKLMSKQYYDGDIKINKVKASIQGQQTMLFFNDLGGIFKRFGYDDLSKSKDFRCQKLNQYSGIDMLRNRMHGKSKIQFGSVDLQIYPKRKFNRYDAYLSIKFYDLFYNQIHNNQELCFRNLIMSKSPLKLYESAFIKIPLIEIQLNMIYNQGKTVNHFIHNGVQTIGQFLDQLKSYSSQEVELDCRLNVPSLGHLNDADKESTQIQQLVSSYFENSPIPIFHYQRSHMSFFDSMLKEYTRKADYSSVVLRRKEREVYHGIRSKRQYLLKVRIKSFFSDLMGIFSHFRENPNQEINIEKAVNQRTLKAERDKYLQNYKGIIFSMENLCIKSLIQFKRAKDGTHIELRNSSMQSNFIRLSFMNCFKQLRDKSFESSLDNYKVFCQFFDINPSAQSSSQMHLQSNSILTNFKTLLPQYILKNTQLQQDIMIASLNPHAMNPFIEDEFNSMIEDFVFSLTDTIGVLLNINYQQDKDICFYHNLNQRMEEKKQQQQQNVNPLILDLKSHNVEEEKFTVKHMIDVKGVRFLYTRQTLELITHHLVKSFNYKKLRRNDYSHTHPEQSDSHHKDIYEQEKHFKKHKHHSNLDHSSSQSDGEMNSEINMNQLTKVPLIGLRLEDPQINFQNEFTKSQMLLTTARPTTAVIFGYSKNVKGQNYYNYKNKFGNADDMNRQQSGYQIKFHKEVVRYDLQIQVVETDVYVAPTVINLENPTFFIRNLGEVAIATNQNEQAHKEKFEHAQKQPGHPNSDRDHYKKEEFVDNVNPKMSIEILVEKLESEMNGPNMWHFVYVLKSILFERGFKTEEIKLNEFNQQFTQVAVSNVAGTHLIYQNKESKVDIDIDRILIENYIDSEAYRMVLFPGYSLQQIEAPNQAVINPQSMIKIRARDKYIVAKEAPWRVYDQFEVFIYPTSFQFTKNFYDQFKKFFFADMPNPESTDKNIQDIKKYELLVPSKMLKKAQSRYKSGQGKNNQEEPDDQSPNSTVIGAPAQEQKPQGLFKLLQNDLIRKSHGIYDVDEDDSLIAEFEEQKKKNKAMTKKASTPTPSFPIFFRYLRMNEIGVSITYYHNKNSFFNSKDLKIKIIPFIRHGKFVTFKRIFEKYGHHCKKHFISQIPSLIKQKFLQTRENFKGTGKALEEGEDDDDEQQEIKKEIKLHNARKIVFGEFYE